MRRSCFSFPDRTNIDLGICFSSPGESLSSNSHCSGPTRTQQRHFQAESSSIEFAIEVCIVTTRARSTRRRVHCIGRGVGVNHGLQQHNMRNIVTPVYSCEGGRMPRVLQSEGRDATTIMDGPPTAAQYVMQCHKITLMRPDERNVQLSACAR